MFENVEEYFSSYYEMDSVKRKEIKKEYFNKILNDRTLFKYISLDDRDTSLNDKKLKCYKNDLIWVSSIFAFDDKTEFTMNIDYDIASIELGQKRETLEMLVNEIRELGDVACFTPSNRPYMWKQYANNYNGFCLEFEVIDYEYFQPVVYCNKNNFDLTRIFINVYKKIQNKGLKIMNDKECLMFSEYSTILKDLKYQEEKEIRLVTNDEYDKNDSVLKGTVYPNKKIESKYLGTAKKYDEVHIKLKRIYIGKNVSPSYRQKLKQYTKPTIIIDESLS